MEKLTQTLEVENINNPNFWGIISGAAKTVGRALANRYLSTNNEPVPFMGPITQNLTHYNNERDKSVVLYVTSVNESGIVKGSGNAYVKFEAYESKPKKQVDEILEANRAGDIAWQYNEAGEDGYIRNFVDLKRWNGDEITLFSFDEIIENDLKIRVKKGEFIAQCNTRNHRFFLEVILIDSDDYAINFDLLIEPRHSQGVIVLPDDFQQSMPLNRLFVKASVIEVRSTE
ncbi:hypothetical protein T190115A13A_80019 [Tenacibaculum sp. 190524A02b]|uniref:Uncharacterized protein n=1 Tax=Tenacibaculum vairaonense TaxID=3137860 RepID=A0ABP1FHT8_9FLAO